MPGMKQSKLLKVLLSVQGSYTLITAVWPLINIQSFMVITGPKTDIWLVKTVAVVLLPIALLLLLHLLRPTDPIHLIVVGLTCSIGLAAIDFYYSIKGTISWVYAVDGVLEFVFFLCWLYIGIRVYTAR